MKNGMSKTVYLKRSLMFAAAGALMFSLLCCAKGSDSSSTNQPATAPNVTMAAPVDSGILSNSDCVKCHTAATQGIRENGGLHKTEVTCQDCHEGHPPEIKDIIPSCNKCHEGKPHYELEGCLSCHSNPHTPKNITLAEHLTDPCLTCHTEQKPQLVEFPSKHSELDCTSCHQKTHGVIPSCLSCHTEGHSPDMVQTDCANCHQAHKPLKVAYADTLASKQCASCHDVAYSLLMASTTKHHDVSCVTCHKSEHKMIPKCQDCHGTPHPATITAKFKGCGDCHNIAHDLNK
jgi:predicted CXXCH cytochrome family protein